MNKKYYGYLFLMTLISSIALFGCGDSGRNGTPVSQSTLSGTAAADEPIIGTVIAKGTKGKAKSAHIEVNGNFSVDVSGLTAPYRLRAQGTVGGRTTKLHSYAEAEDVGGNTNITPFTDLIVANAAGQLAEDFFDSDTTTELDSDVVDEQETALQARLQNILDTLGVETTIDLIHTNFDTELSGMGDAMNIILIEVNTETNVATITNTLEENNTITDNITDPSDTGTLPVSNPPRE